MRHISIGLSLTAFTTLMMELTLIKVFDVIWTPNMAYMVVTCTMFCFGLAGVYSTLRPIRRLDRVNIYLCGFALMFVLTSLAIRPIMNAVPFSFDKLYSDPISGGAYLLCIYLALSIPFFFAGMIFTTVFTVYSDKIQMLYFWDLAGAALGCVFFIPFIPKIGPGGLLFCAGAIGVIAAGLFSGRRIAINLAAAVAVGLVLLPFLKVDGYYDFRQHISKRGLIDYQRRNKIEMTYWDPISKIDVVDAGDRKWIAYDGGSQSSYIYPFDGDLKTLRNQLPDITARHFWGRIVLASHFLKRDSDQKVLVIGSAGGQETKAALTYGAAHVDAVEMVGVVVRIGLGIYAPYGGNIFNHSRVQAIAGEGRSFLRTSDTQYDIIQIFSNHTSSSMAAGTGAMATNYLQTAEAYIEYFQHLKDDGILHINHHVYPRMVTTAALAWKRMGRSDFQKHVVVFEVPGVQDNLPTFLVKMTPWTAAEIDTLTSFYTTRHGQPLSLLMENPIDPSKSYLPPEFYDGNFPSALESRINYRVGPATDNRPYFNFLRKEMGPVAPDPERYLNQSTSELLNSQIEGGFPQDLIHLFVTGIASLFFAGVFILVPLFFSESGKTKWPRKTSSLVYFSSLGAGFIIFELVFIQIFMKLIGYPLYTYSTVVFAFLFAAGFGSYCSGKIGLSLNRLWYLPFAGILVVGTALILMHQSIFEVFLASATGVRIAVAFAMIAPLGFFMGIPFPLGILAIKDYPRGSIAWAWGLNGLFTVIGGLASIVLSIYVGFRESLVITMLIYALAFAMFCRIRIPQPPQSAG